MATRATPARKATERSIYVDPPEFDEIGGSSDEEEVGDETDDDDEWSARAKKGGKGRGKKDNENGAPSKKRKTGKGKGKGKGKAKEVKEDLLKTMPMDLLVEIFSYLLPGELLTMSRTSKSYRALLTSKNSKPLWRTSRRLVDLPDLESEGVSEMAYAALMFDQVCASCMKKYTGRPDFYLRLLLCKECRKEHFVSLQNLDKTHPGYHPLLADVVPSTPHTASSPKYGHPYYRSALLADLEQYNKILSELQDEDDLDEMVAETRPFASARTRSGRASREYSQDDPSQIETGTRDGDLMKKTYPVAKQKAQSAFYQWWHRVAGPLREATKKADKPGNGINYDQWARIKPEVIELITKDQASQKKFDQAAKEQARWDKLVTAREQALRARHKTLRASQKDRFSRAAFPLEADFLLFESVKPLQLPDKPVKDSHKDDAKLDDGDWAAALPLIQDEVEQYRLELVLHAVKLTRAAMFGEDDLPDDEELLADLEAEGVSKLATSFLCCDIDCHRRGWWHFNRSTPSRDTFIGDLQSLLEHQHQAHAKDVRYRTKKDKEQGPRFHFSLPGEVACAISALLDVGELDAGTAGQRELDAMDQSAALLRWDNSPKKRKKYSGWKHMLDAIYLEATRYSRMKPPRTLPPPLVVYRPRRSPARAVAASPSPLRSPSPPARKRSPSVASTQVGDDFEGDDRRPSRWIETSDEDEDSDDE
ncbi:hypothetical protein JCM10213_006495 [Rhodosporidiobolus nylandii]